METYYRFQNEAPIFGEQVHCYKNLQDLKSFASMMKNQDPNFRFMKFWQIEGYFVREDDGDAVVRVNSVKEIFL